MPTQASAINNSITTLTATSAGACQFNVTKAASTNYNAATSASFTLVVTKAAQTINFTTQVPMNAVSGGTYAIAATTNAGLTVSFSLASGSSTYCSISGSTITFLATGNCVVNANQAGNTSYNPAPTRYTDVKDSGAREEFSTGSRRDTQDGKGRFDLISPIALRRLAVHYENGSRKYGDRNWEKGQPLGRYVSSGMRHWLALLEGDHSEDHAAAVAWNAFAFIHTADAIARGTLPAELDDIGFVNVTTITECVTCESSSVASSGSSAGQPASSSPAGDGATTASKRSCCAGLPDTVQFSTP